MAENIEPPAGQVEALRAQLRALAGAAGLPVPELTVDQPRAQDRLPRVDGSGTVIVPRSLLTAEPARQLWHLAACLGRLTSPVPRQRQRMSWVLFAVAGLAYIALIVAVPTATWVWLTIALLYPLGSWTARWERRAMEEAGRAVLTGAGHDPAAVARQAFGGDPEPTLWRHLLSNEPTPRERIAAAEGPPPA